MLMQAHHVSRGMAIRFLDSTGGCEVKKIGECSDLARVHFNDALCVPRAAVVEVVGRDAVKAAKERHPAGKRASRGFAKGRA